MCIEVKLLPNAPLHFVYVFIVPSALFGVQKYPVSQYIIYPVF